MFSTSHVALIQIITKRIVKRYPSMIRPHQKRKKKDSPAYLNRDNFGINVLNMKFMYLAGVAKEKKKGTGLMVTRASCPPKRSLNIDEYYAFCCQDLLTYWYAM